jgi:hypothetical protein
VTSITKDLSGIDGGRNHRAAGPDRPRPAAPWQPGGDKYEPVSNSTVVSRFGPFRLQVRTTFAPVSPASMRLQLVIGPPRLRGHRVVAAADDGRFRKTMLRSLRSSKEQVEATASPTT